MIRLIQMLLFVAAIVVVWMLVRRALANLQGGGPKADAFEPMARCASCGTHVRRTELDAGGLCPACQNGDPPAA